MKFTHLRPESEGSPLHLAESEESLVGLDQCGVGVEGTEEETQQLKDGVCQNVVCPPLDCTRPVLPHLHCCYICGWSGYGVARLHASGGPIQRATVTSVLSTFFLPLLAAIAGISAIIFYLGEVRSFREFGRQLDTVVFARFENLNGTDDGEDRIRVQIEKPPAPPSPPLKVRSARGSWTASPRQFQNPLFQESPLRSEETALTDFSPPNVENKSVTHENPLYAELLKREKELESTIGADNLSQNESPSSSDNVDSSPLVDIDL